MRLETQCKCKHTADVPRQPDLPNCRQLALPVHLLGRSSLAVLLGCISPVAGYVKLEDDGVVHHPVNHHGGGHRVGEDTLPLRGDQVGRDAQRPAFVAFCDGGEKDFRLFVPLGQVAQVVQEQEVEVVQLAQLSGQGEVPLGGQQVLHQVVGRCEEDGVSSFHQTVAQGAERVSLAGAMTKSPLGGGKPGANPTNRGKRGVKRSLLTEAQGIPVGLAVDGANRHDMKLVRVTVDSLPVS